MIDTAVEICNNALADIGITTAIASLNDDDVEGRLAGRYYPQQRDSLLAAFPWSFARRVAVLALSSEDPTSNWLYRYVEPEDCLKPREILHDSDTEDEPPFDREVNEDNNAVTILTDREEASLVYTRRVEYPGMFPPEFIEALQYALAAKFAMGIKNNIKLARDFSTLSKNTALNAMGTDRSSVKEKRNHEPEWQKNRA